MIGAGFEFGAGVFGFILVCFLIVGVFYLIKDAFEDLQSRIQSRKWQRKRLLERKNRDNEKKRLGSCRKTLGSNPASNPKSMRSSLKTRI